MKQKRHKYGIKLFKLCCGLGYTYALIVYAGKNGLEKTTPMSVVMSLAEPILDSGRTLCTDNCYTSMELAENLISRETHLVGTIRKNRKRAPKDVLQKRKMKKGDAVAKESMTGITVLNWKDTRNVTMLSTKHSDEMVEIENKRGDVTRKPAIVVDYNKSKGSVDLSDQMTAYSTPLHKTVKWYRKLAIELIPSTSMVNAYILYNECTGKPTQTVDFRHDIAMALIQSTGDQPVPVNPPVQRPTRVRHELKKRDGLSHSTKKFCKKCYDTIRRNGDRKASKKTKKVNTYCSGCEGEPHYCLPCFNTVHR